MKNILIALLCITANVSFAQQPLIRCETMEADSALRAAHSLESLPDFENWLQAKIAAYRASAEYSANRRSIITIPIIFHVISNGEAVGSGTNLSQTQINSQIAVLNEDYRKAFGTRGYNTNPVGADCEMEFCAAVVDPNGNILTEPGIDRRNMGQASWARTDIDATLKPQTYWDPTRYFNVWTVNFGGSSSNLLGYAQFPNTSGLQGINNNNGNANTDGVVIRYTACGRVGTLDNIYKYGRTLTHEAGHFFGLRHIWGDQTCGDDYCNDTPTSTDANYGCPTGQSTCSHPGTPDMIDNYMDYTNDACMDIFTQNQKDRMWVVLNNSPRRSTLTSSNVCTVPFTFSYTGKVVDALTQQGIPNAKVFFDGPADYNLTTDANGFFTISNLQQDNYTVYAGKWGYVTNTRAQQAYTPSTPQITIPIQQGYYDDALLDFVWTVTGNATTGVWTRGVPSGTSYTTGGVTYASNPGADVTGDYGNTCFITGNGGGAAGDDDVDGGTTTITSPVMDLSSYADPVLRYYRWFYNGGGTGTPNDSLVISLVNGTQVIDIDKVGQGANSNQWIYKSYRVKNYIANPGNNIKVQYRTFDQSSAGHLVEAGLDLFRVIDSSATSSQPPIANFSSNSTTVCPGTSVTFNDLSSNNPYQWNWQFQGGSPSTSAIANPTVSYSAPGTYAVTLTATNAAGSNTSTQTAYITVSPVVAQFSQDKLEICPGQSIAFSNGTSCNPTNIKWIFNGGTPSTSTDQDPVIDYNQPGYFDVTLIAGNQLGTDTLVQNLAVHVYAPSQLNTTATPDTNNTGAGTATVNVISGVAPYTYVWTDPQHQTTQTATNLAAGIYNVNVTDANGCTSITSVTVGNVIVSGIIELNNSYLRCYPNPVSGSNTITLTVSDDWKGSTLTLTNAMGQIAGSYQLQTSTYSVPLSQMPAGIYMLRVYNSKQQQVIRLVKE